MRLVAENVELRLHVRVHRGPRARAAIESDVREIRDVLLLAECLRGRQLRADQPAEGRPAQGGHRLVRVAAHKMRLRLRGFRHDLQHDKRGGAVVEAAELRGEIQLPGNRVVPARPLGEALLKRKENRGLLLDRIVELRAVYHHHGALRDIAHILHRDKAVAADLQKALPREHAEQVCQREENADRLALREENAAQLVRHLRVNNIVHRDHLLLAVHREVNHALFVRLHGRRLHFRTL